MTIGQEEHLHEHKFVEIVDAETISAYEQVPHGVITLRLHERGLALDLTYDEATDLGAVMAKVMDHVNTRLQQR